MDGNEQLYKDVDDYIISVLKVTKANTVTAEKYGLLYGRSDRHAFYDEVRERIEDIICAMREGDI